MEFVKNILDPGRTEELVACMAQKFGHVDMASVGAELNHLPSPMVFGP